MKRFIVFFVILSFAISFLFRQNTSAQVDVDNIYCMGNGRMAAYATGMDIIQLFGAPYSSPSLLQLICIDTSLKVRSKREAGTAIWNHEIYKNELKIGSITDFVDAESPCFVRKYKLKQSLTFTLDINERANIIGNSVSFTDKNVNDAFIIESPRGIPYYNDYPMPFKQCLQVVGKNSVTMTPSSRENVYTIHCEKGKGELYITGGPLYPECVKNSEMVLSVSYEKLLDRTRQWWSEFTARRTNFDETLSVDVPMREKLLQTIDDVAVNIKTQQAVEGGVLAGHNYHLGYVRDQYGVSRCLLKMGYYQEAHDILNFYWNVWQQHGKICNAQGMGVDGFHVHENDQVEITGYMIIQAFDYMERSNDSLFVREIFPLLEWAWNCQKKNFVKNMLPFNGDETYVAGGVLPRSALNDGSAEATLLFITGGEKFLKYIQKNALWNDETLAANIKLLKNIKQEYRPNFYQDNHLITNNPERTVGMDLPCFRHGVCESCNSFGWTQKTENDRYLCPKCFGEIDLPRVPQVKYILQSVSLTPKYIGSDLFSNTEISEMVLEILDTYIKTGKLPSRPDGNITVGYDYGLLLYNLNLMNNDSALKIYEEMLSILDETGSWVEYYDESKPKGTRYRPWESSINMEAAIDFAQNY